jgi:hypothetical protein
MTRSIEHLNNDLDSNLNSIRHEIKFKGTVLKNLELDMNDQYTLKI